MNSLRTRARKFEEMGLGPEWVLRSKREGPEETEMIISDEVSSDDVLSIEKNVLEKQTAAGIPVSTTLKENTPVSLVMDARADFASWEDLTDSIKKCTRCDLCQTRTNTVPGVGDIQADWLFIGEGPGYYEDQQGEPFVGPSGKLLDNMMASLGMKRGKKVYIANIVKCRASDNNRKDRPPTQEESLKCMPYLDWQIRQIRPKIIVALGRTAAAGLLNMGPDVNMAAMRGKIHYLSVDNNEIPLIVTYHPAYLLRTPMAKKQAWADLCLAVEAIEKS